ncbi:MAG: hypothetical protein KTR31_10515 [Myxococcales bacterium]|nr:hypothetical protein [Myxococcales bacterium]
MTRWINFLFLPVLWYNLRVFGVVRMGDGVRGPGRVLRHGFCEPLPESGGVMEATMGVGPQLYAAKAPNCFDGDTYLSPMPCQLSNPCMQLPEMASMLDTPLAVVWRVSEGDLLIAAAVLILMVEVMRYTDQPAKVLVRRLMALAVLLFTVFESLVNIAFASSTFLILALILVLDVVAGLWVAFRVHVPQHGPPEM